MLDKGPSGALARVVVEALRPHAAIESIGKTMHACPHHDTARGGLMRTRGGRAWAQAAVRAAVWAGKAAGAELGRLNGWITVCRVSHCGGKERQEQEKQRHRVRSDIA